MTIVNLILLLSILIIVTRYYSKDYYLGIVISIFFLITAPERILIIMPGTLPDLNLYRLILVVMFIFWVKNKSVVVHFKSVPFFYNLVLVGFTASVSTFFSVCFLASLKNLFAFVTEQFLFFIIIYTSCINLNNDKLENLCKKIIASVTLGMGLITLLGVIERWTNFSIVDYLPTVNLVGFSMDGLHSYKNRVTSTMPHPILLGYILAMWWATILVLLQKNFITVKKSVLYIIFCLACSCIYFTVSRGAWLGTIFSGLIMFALASGPIKKSILIAVCILFLVFFIRPQISTTVKNLMNTMYDSSASSLKSRSYQYRYELWWKANEEISKTTFRFFWGYGDNSRHYMQISGVERVSGRVSRFWSWDNEYATILLERGYLGFIAFVILYIKIWVEMFKGLKKKNSVYRNFMVAMFTGVAVYTFMMSNVKIFSSQIVFVFWTMVLLFFAFNKLHHKTDFI